MNSSTSPDSIFTFTTHLPSLERGPAFLALKHWFRETWSKLKSGETTAESEDPILVQFLEDKNGLILPKSEMQAVRNSVKAYFEFLWDKKRAPPCWGEAPRDLRIDFVRKMEEEFEWLRYCDRHWKAEQLFMNYYPQWYRSKTQPRKSLKRKERLDNDRDSNENPGAPKHPRVAEPEPSPAPAPPAPPAPPTQPASTSVSTTRRRVRSLRLLLFM
jgi:hypothetical protein